MWYKAKSLIAHYYRSTTVYQEHSPFFYDLWKKVLIKKMGKEGRTVAHIARKKLRRDQTPVSRTDYGAQSTMTKPQTTIAHLAKTSLSPHWKAGILHHLISHYQSQKILELGTSLGLTTAYLAMQDHDCHVWSLEGDPTLSNYAKRLHHELGLSNIEVIEGVFNQTLAPVLQQAGTLDMVFLDGDHTEGGVMENFERIYPYLSSEGVMVLDDIYWSPGMTRAWQNIKDHPGVTASLLYYDLGFLFFDKKRPYPLHLEWVDRWLKPWTILKAL